RSTTPYAPGVAPSDMRLIHEIVPCHHAAKASGEAIGESRLIGWTHAQEHRRILVHRVDRDDWHVSEASLRRSICRTGAYRRPRARRVRTQQPRCLARTKADRRTFDLRLQLSVEPLPSFEVASHVLNTRRRVQGFGLRRITTPANRHLECAQRVRRL